MEEHHPHGPSSLDLQALCPGSYRMCLDIENESNEFSEEGTMLHERVWTNKTDDLTEEQKELVAFVRRWVNHVYKEEECSKIYKEEKISLFNREGQMLNFGTLDFATIQPGGYCFLADFKFGRKLVPTDSLQLKSYALSLFQRHWDIRTIWAYIIQPRLNRVEYIVFHESQQEEMLRDIDDLITKCNSTYPALISGDHCDGKYCRAKDVCSAYKIKGK